VTEPHASFATDSELAARVREVEAQLAAERVKLAEVTAERDRLRRAYQILIEHYELLRRKLFVAKAERIDATQLEIEFAETKAKLDALAKQLGTELEGPPERADAQPLSSPPSGDEPKKKRTKTTPTARRNLREEDMLEKRIEILDPALEGTCERIGFEESCRHGYQRGCAVRLVIARAKYKKKVEANEASDTSSAVDADEDGGKENAFEIVTAKKPKELVERGLLAPSLIAHMLVAKYRFGIPFHRLAVMFRAQGVRLDDGTMCRYAEDVGATLGCIVDAMAKEAKESAFCLSTDATGVCIQPEPLASGKRQACRKGHLCPAAHKCPYAEPRFMRSRSDRTAMFGAIRAVS
jgi:transposase